MSTALTDYVAALAKSSPEQAVKIALAESEKATANAARAAEEYRAMAEVTFDGKGRIARANMAGLYRLANIYASSKIVPDHYKGSQADCFIACQMASRLGVDPLAYMQKSYIVHGKPGIEAQLAIAMLNTSGKIKGRIMYRAEGTGDSRKVTAYAIDAETGGEVSAYVDWAMVVAEGWAGKSGSKWKTMPEVMFRYRSAALLIRGFYPEVLMGVNLSDELEDMHTVTSTVQTERVTTLDDLTNRLAGPTNGNGNGHKQTAEEADDKNYNEQGEYIGPTQEEAKQESPDDNAGMKADAGQEGLDKLFDELNACTTLESVNKIVSREIESNRWNTAQLDKLDTLAEAARQAIRNKRGSGSNTKKQAELAGA